MMKTIYKVIECKDCVKLLEIKKKDLIYYITINEVIIGFFKSFEIANARFEKEIKELENKEVNNE